MSETDGVWDCVTEEDAEFLVEFVVVTHVVEWSVLFKEFDIPDEVAISVVKSIVCRWCVVLMSAVLNDSVADGSGFSVNFLLSKCKKIIYFRDENIQCIHFFYKWIKTSPGYEHGEGQMICEIRSVSLSI